MLLKQGLVQLLPNFARPSSSKNVYCQFHQNGGHTTDRCRNFKNKIQDLIDEGKIAIEEEAAPAAGNAANPNERMGVFKDPLPNHPPVTCPRSLGFSSSIYPSDDV